MKKFSIIINEKIIEYSADTFTVSDDRILLYINNLVVAYFPKSVSIMETPND